MILAYAVLGGLGAGLVRAGWGGRHLQVPQLQHTWLVVLAFLSQFVAFHLPATRPVVSDGVAAGALVVSQALLLIFAWYNRQEAGIVVLGVGTALNLLVIAFNGGLMPISPGTVLRLAPGASANSLKIGERLWQGKDIVLPLREMRFWWLSDYFVLSRGYRYRVAFSLGDVVIAMGAFWLFWAMGKAPGKVGESQTTESFRKTGYLSID
jgi:hypothetical protein